MTRPDRPAVLSIGSNQGDRLGHLKAALAALRAIDGLAIEKVSSVYETKPWGVEEQPDFLNIVVAGSTNLPPEELLAQCLAIEDANGRERTLRWGPRTLDIDVVAVGDDVVATDDLHLPHPRAKDRAFVIVPWVEIEPSGILPGWGPLRELADGFDPDEVRLDEDLTRRLGADE